jgi:cytoskeleton protein RodZ
MLESNTNGADQAAPEIPTAGALLKQARESKNLTREAVADQLNLLLSHVIALEENHFARFPGETFVRGHLRSYARLLNIDAAELLRLYGGAAPTVNRAPPAPTHLQWRPLSLEHKTSRWRSYSGVAATLLVLFALWGWQQQRDRAQRLSLTADGGDTHELFAGGIDSALNSGAENALLDSVELISNADAKPAATPAATEGNAGATTSTATNTAAAEEIDKLSLRFSADCWIEIKDRDNKLIVATLKRADEKLQIEGHGPFKVLLGYAPGVSMAYNGSPVKVDVPEGNRSTRLIVGSS